MTLEQFPADSVVLGSSAGLVLMASVLLGFGLHDTWRNVRAWIRGHQMQGPLIALVEVVIAAAALGLLVH